MPRVFTLFNHGTDYHRDMNPNEVVTLLHDAMAGEEARIVQGPVTDENESGFKLAHDNPTFLICEGPGSNAVDAADSTRAQHRVSHSHPGLENPIFNQPKELVNNPFAPTRVRMHQTPGSLTQPSRLEVYKELLPTSEFRQGFIGQTPWNYQTTGRVKGTGWDDNVYRATWLLSHLKFERKYDIQTVNMVGWSRGAVTCIKQANKLYEVFGHRVRVNIFAIDPVPGGLTTQTPDMLLLPPNVQDCLVVLASDDDRSNFQPIDLQSLKVTCPTGDSAFAPNVHFLPLPGNHADVVTVDNSRYAVNSARLCLHLAHKFLSHHGTVFAQVPAAGSMTVQQILNAYDALMTDRASIKKKAACGTFDLVGGFKRKERHVRKSVAEYVLDSSHWINEHHRMCALSPNLKTPGRPAIKLDAGVPYKPWQALLSQMGILYSEDRTPRKMRRV